MKLFIYRLVVLLFVFMCFSCNTQDETENTVSLSFQYSKSIDGSDNFASEVDKVNLYIFNSAGRLEDEYYLNVSELRNKNVIDLDLEPGVYSFVVWGNLTDSYSLCALEKGVTNIEDCHLSIKCQGNVVSDCLPHLFYGSSFNVEVLPASSNEFSIDMVKKTKSIHITAVNSTVESPDKMPYGCKITSFDRGYTFNNTILRSEELVYHPRTGISDEGEYMVNFVLLLSNDNSNSRLIITENEQEDGKVRELVNIPVLELLLPASLPGNFELADSFSVDIHLNN
ncbi:hypothetical protein M2459_003488 [Parabacteroides sp. PF5-5]|uniref:FimB/Mfa2 family fimbrial subunit n=1 Tax=unclassified Parabacteroides TaxID=2649774 RepID=UPI002474C2A3|nr:MULTISPECIES: FimB/Mfa2 family fimbrial subunit [unclassified Parabacteroides]MDH6306885.1 hypothetical protein [Parabacteroides sp. PH5-39]MDH6317727.1 hypothetical protein [Parabacteroides sp. PF5-13]MDH6321599.1 hypothetical protein [Parabacteroides sp. PH5-13]MDH6325272.1 hypothetical protein [Parabacteroides sp. PH5-8]MDH6328912.1 hypothetical protein [Parabacteroides sp. PH5-41]